jgi:hypothetical protein
LLAGSEYVYSAGIVSYLCDAAFRSLLKFAKASVSLWSSLRALEGIVSDDANAVSALPMIRL